MNKMMLAMLAFAAAPAGAQVIELAGVPGGPGVFSPVSVTSAGDGSGRLFVVEQAGGIIAFLPQIGPVLPLPGVLLDIQTLVATGGEQGQRGGMNHHPR